MALISSKAIVLKTINFGEGHKIVTFFTLNYGKIKVVVKGAKSSKNKYGASLEPMMLTNVVYYDKPSRDLQNISQSDLIKFYGKLTENFELLSWGHYLIELVDELTAERDPAKEVFYLLENVLESLESTTNLKLLIKYFEIKLFKICGYAFQLKTCALCGNEIILHKEGVIFDIIKSGFYCKKCSQLNRGFVISGEAFKILDIITDIDIKKIERLKISKKAQEELEYILDLYRKKYLHKELKSLKFIKSTSNV